MSTRGNQSGLVRKWIEQQSAKTPLVPSAIAYDLRDQVNPIEIARVLGQLNLENRVVRVFAVRVPSGVILNRVYNRLDEIEEVVYDSLNRQVPRDELEIIPAFVKASD
jgi:dephospho-CoA kinase